MTFKAQIGLSVDSDRPSPLQAYFVFCAPMLFCDFLTRIKMLRRGEVVRIVSKPIA